MQQVAKQLKNLSIDGVELLEVDEVSVEQTIYMPTLAKGNKDEFVLMTT